MIFPPLPFTGMIASQITAGQYSYLKEPGCVADNVWELEDVGSELLLHVAQEKHCILGAESTNACHCEHKVTRNNLESN